MPWGRLDDEMNGNDKLNALGADAFRVWIRGLVYCQKNLTDGFIPDHALPIIMAFVRDRDRPKVIAQLCAALVAGKAPLWHKVEGGYQMHDYLDWNDSREKVLAARDKAEQRMGKFRDRRRGERRQHLVNAVVNTVTNAVRNALQNGTSNAVQNASSTYHVPRKNEKQERADADSLPVENPERLALVRRNRRIRSRETTDGRPSLPVITAVARDVVRMNPHEQDEAELREMVKQACSQANLKYDGQTVGRALEAAVAQLRRTA